MLAYAAFNELKNRRLEVGLFLALKHFLCNPTFNIPSAVSHAVGTSSEVHHHEGHEEHEGRQ